MITSLSLSLSARSSLLALLSRIIILDPTKNSGLDLWPVAVWMPIPSHPQRHALWGDGLTPAVLRSLSQTCASLRAFTLPILWSIIHVSTIDEVGRLGELLKASPHLARHIKSFCFFWNMNPGGEAYSQYRYEEYGEGNMSMLQLAFSNRVRMWRELLHKYKCSGAVADLQFRKVLGGGEVRPTLHFVHEGNKYYCPAEPPQIEGEDRFKLRSYDWNAVQSRGTGPDGMGEDRLIKNGEQLIKCLEEVVEQIISMSVLETFSWNSPVLPMPLGVLNALAKLPTLKRFHPGLITGSPIAHACECRRFGPM